MKRNDFIGMTKEEAILYIATGDKPSTTYKDAHLEFIKHYSGMNDHEIMLQITSTLSEDDSAFFIKMWNEYAEVNNENYQIYDLTAETLNQFFPSAADFAEKVSYQQAFKWQDPYFYMTECGEPISFCYLDDVRCPIVFEDLINYLINFE